MEKAHLLLILLLSLSLTGCTQTLSKEELAKTGEYCPLSGQEIQDFCGVSLKEVTFYESYSNSSIRSDRMDFKQCLYILQDDESDYHEISIMTYPAKNATMESVRGLYDVNHQDVDFADGAAYIGSYAGDYDSRPFLFFQSGGMLHSVSVYKGSGLLGKSRCETKEGLLMLAERYLEKMNGSGYPE